VDRLYVSFQKSKAKDVNVKPRTQSRIEIESKLRRPLIQGTANPTWGDIFESSFKAQSAKLEWLFSLKCSKRDAQALSFEL